MRSSFLFVVATGFVTLWLIEAAPLRLAKAQTKSEAPLDILVHRHVMVAARDGIRLATDVYLPARNGVVLNRVPAIVERTPYNKDRGPDALVNFFVPRGYAVVLQDVRGRYRSEGRWRPITDDGPDGADLLKWIAEQSWSSGKVGMVGTSYAGATQHAVGITNAPALAALVPVDAMSDPGYFGVRHNGAFELRWLNWILTLGNATGTSAGPTGLLPGPHAQLAGLRAAKEPSAAPALVAMGSQVREFVKALPLRPGTTPLKFAPDYETWLIEAMKHGDNDAFWADMGSSVIDHVARYQDVPVMHLTGWYDSWGAQVANLNYVELSKVKKQKQRLIVGPWTHGGQGTSFSGIAEFGPAAAISLNAQGCLERCGGRPSRPPLRHGRRRAQQDEGGPAVRRRGLARRTRVAACPGGQHGVLPSCGRHARHEGAGRCAAHPLRLRPPAAGAYDRWQCLFRGRSDAPRGAGPAMRHG